MNADTISHATRTMDNHAARSGTTVPHDEHPWVKTAQATLFVTKDACTQDVIRCLVQQILANVLTNVRVAVQ